MAAVNLAFDGLLVLTLIGVAVATLMGQRAFRAVVLFVVFGLLLALAWVRLGALDLALAEAAIGAGVTGALLMAALARLRRAGSRPATSAPRLLLAVGLATPIAAAGTAALLGHAPVPRPPTLEYLGTSGLDHPVTAVLLVFRAWDTLLEVAVLTAAGMAVCALGAVPRPPATEVGSLQRSLLRLVVPILMVLAIYLLWRGSHAPGGAFQAGALLAAAGILFQLTWFPGPMNRDAWWQRPAVGSGLAVFLLAGLAILFPPPVAEVKSLVLIIEAITALAIGVLLTRLFAGGAPLSGGGR